MPYEGRKIKRPLPMSMKYLSQNLPCDMEENHGNPDMVTSLTTEIRLGSFRMQRSVTLCCSV
jgi:hypothetical protein